MQEEEKGDNEDDHEVEYKEGGGYKYQDEDDVGRYVYWQGEAAWYLVKEVDGCEGIDKSD